MLPTFQIHLLNRLCRGLLMLALWISTGAAYAQISSTPDSLYLIAGSTQGSTDGTGAAARFNYPFGITADAAGNLYVVDTANHAIRKITPAGAVTTVAGMAGQPGSADGTNTAARFYGPTGIAVDATGNLYVADQGNSTIRKITPAGAVTTIAGMAEQIGSADGASTAARFRYPYGVTADAAGNLYVADSGNQTIRKITLAGVVTTIAGMAGQWGRDDGTGAAARFNYPYGITADAAGNLYVADTNNLTIRKITPAGVVTTIAGMAGQGGSVDGTGAAARFSYPSGIISDTAGNLFVADTGNHTIRKITLDGVVTTVVGVADAPGLLLGTLPGRISLPRGVAVLGNDHLAITTEHSVLGVNLFTAPATVSFASFTSSLLLTITPNASRFTLNSTLALAANGKAFDPVADIVSLEIGNIAMNIPAGSFQADAAGGYTFQGVIGGIDLDATISDQGVGSYTVSINGAGANLSGITNPVSVTLKLGNNVGNQSITATMAGSAKNPGKPANPGKPVKGGTVTDNPFAQ